MTYADAISYAGAAARRIYNPVQRDAATFLETSEESGGRRTLVELEVAPGGRVVPHHHLTYTECFLVREGELTVRADGAQRRLGPGDEVIVPIGADHAWVNQSERRAVARVELQPGHAGFERCLRIGYGLAADGRVTKDGLPRNPLHVALLLEWGDMRLTGMAGRLQPLLAQLARVARRLGVDRELERRYLAGGGAR
jgi:quercetin dioxygenase-like cupin family protein